MLYEKVKKTIKEHGLLERGDKVICAVSGGADSMCLLTVMKALAAEMDLTVCAANLNHSLRGAEGDGDSQYVETICEIRGIPFYGKKLDIATMAKARGKSVEETGREERYRFFDEISASLGGAKIATGHNISDNAETILFRLARGSGSRGLCGIRYKRGNIIRPLLDVSRSEIEEYLLENAVMWREDSTNAELVYTRNMIRHTVVPRLEEINPSAVEKIVDCAKSLSEDEEYLRSLAEKLLSSALVDKDEYSTSAILGAPAPIAKRAAALLLEDWGARDIDQQKINALLDLCTKPSGKQMDINGDVYALRSFYTIMKESRQQERGFLMTLRPGQRVSQPGWEIYIYVTDTPPPQSASVAIFDAAQLFGLFTVRSRRDGDKIRLKGDAGSKKLKDLFIEMKIPQSRRASVPVVSRGDEIVFVPPLRKSPRYAPGESTRSFLVIQYSEKE